jgi:hypothetical protein
MRNVVIITLILLLAMLINLYRINCDDAKIIHDLNLKYDRVWKVKNDGTWLVCSDDKCYMTVPRWFGLCYFCSMYEITGLSLKTYNISDEANRSLK